MERVNLLTGEGENWINDAAGEAEAHSCFDSTCQAVANILRWLFALSLLVDAEIGLMESTLRRKVPTPV
jgi:hypothetical protein